MRIIPAILTSNTDELLRQLEYIVEFTDEVDIDIMDGSFVPHESIKLKELPTKDGLAYNLDLMVAKPIDYIHEIIELKKQDKLNVNRVFVHIESNFNVDEIIKLSMGNFILGFSLSIPTSTENFLNISNKVKSTTNSLPPVQLKTVEIGKQGNPYHPEVLAKIGELRKAGFQGEIYIDGGIDPDIVKSLKEYDIAGVSVGSFISHSSDPLKSFNTLKDATWKKELD